MDVLGQYAEVWVVDTEFYRPPGGLPKPVCCVCAKELKTGREVRVWTGDGAPQPFDTGPRPVGGAVQQRGVGVVPGARMVFANQRG